MEDKHLVFSYGTLRNKDYQILLFGREIESKDALLENYSIYVDLSDGYYFLKEEEGSVVYGNVLFLTTEELWKADQWEEIPYYNRKLLQVKIHNEYVYCWVYLKNSKNYQKVENTKFSNVPNEEVIKQIKSLNEQLKYHKLPFCDLYIFLPCSIFDEKKYEESQKNQNCDYFIETFNKVTAEEFESHIHKGIDRYLYTSQEIVVLSNNEIKNSNSVEITEKIKDIYFYKDLVEIGRQKVNFYISVHKETKLAILIIALPACSVSPLHILNNMSQGILTIINPDKPNTYLSVDNFLKQNGLEIDGLPRASIFLSKKPDDSNIISLLAAESDSQDKIIGEYFIQRLNINISQYAYVDMYASEISLVEIPHNFELDYLSRIPDEILTIFIIELLMLQESALGGVSKNILKELSFQNFSYNNTDQASDIIENLLKKMSKAFIFWNVRNFRYRTAQKLADQISIAFDMDKLYRNYEMSKSLLEQLIDINTSKKIEKENKSINILLILLTFVQILPTLYEIGLSLITKNINYENIMASILSIFTCFIIIGIFLIKKNISKNLDLLKKHKKKQKK